MRGLGSSGQPVTKEQIRSALEQLHVAILRGVRSRLELGDEEGLRVAERVGEGDVSFRIDVVAERTVEAFFAGQTWLHPISVVAEGLGQRTYPEDAEEEDVRWRVIIDPLDGTRGLMYGLRSAWILSGAAPNRGGPGDLGEISVAVQTEVPVRRDRSSISVTAIRGLGAVERECDAASGRAVSPARNLRSSEDPTIRGGFAPFVHFFPGSHARVGALADRVFERVLGPPLPGEAAVFDDQYLSTGGQIYLLASGRYRLVADLRPVLAAIEEPPAAGSLCARPYDLATWLVAKEAGATITDADGGHLAYPLDTHADCAWLGYANEQIRRGVEPVIHEELRKLAGHPPASR